LPQDLENRHRTVAVGPEHRAAPVRKRALPAAGGLEHGIEALEPPLGRQLLLHAVRRVQRPQALPVPGVKAIDRLARDVDLATRHSTLLVEVCLAHRRTPAPKALSTDARPGHMPCLKGARRCACNVGSRWPRPMSSRARALSYSIKLTKRRAAVTEADLEQRHSA